jgi:hypothetical protein
LDRNRDLHENIVLRFRLDLYLELLNLHAHALHYGFQVRVLPIQARPGNSRELSKPLHNSYLRRLNRKERTQKYTQGEEANNREQNEEESGHVHSPFNSVANGCEVCDWARAEPFAQSCSFVIRRLQGTGVGGFFCSGSRDISTASAANQRRLGQALTINRAAPTP